MPGLSEILIAVGIYVVGALTGVSFWAWIKRRAAKARARLDPPGP